MQNARPVPATNPFNGVEHIRELKEAVAFFTGRTAGKILFLSDGVRTAFPQFALAPRAISLVLDGDDVLPLFALPDEIGGIAAAGGATAMRLARYFAEVRNVPCLLVPNAMQDGVFGRQGSVKIDGVPRLVWLKEADVVFTGAQTANSLARAAFRLMLARLALFEHRMLCKFRGEAESPLVGSARAVLCGDGSQTEQNAALRRLEAEGLPRGEGVVLAEMLACENPERTAYTLLSALYTAFFRRGRPRRMRVPDYRARAKRAGVPYARLSIPTVEEYARRARLLEQLRGEAAFMLEGIRREASPCFPLCTDAFDADGARAALAVLPERGGGLTAVIRDLGLLEDL